MAATKSYNLVFALIFAAVGTTSCQSLDVIKPTFPKKDYKTQSSEEIGAGAVVSQSELKP